MPSASVASSLTAGERRACLCVESILAKARSVKLRKIAPEEDVDRQQDDGIHVADASPEWLLLDAG